jgi:CIC family chloride channel protein
MVFKKKISISFLKFDFGSWLLLLVSLIIGLGGGLFAVLFRLMIGWSNTLFTGAGHTIFGFLPANLWRITVPALAGIIVGPLIYFLAREAKGHGVPEVMEAVALRGGRMRMRVIFVKAIASASSIGSGASVGREGPIIQMGSGIGSVVSQWFKLHEDKIKICVGCGAAAGISATFNAPMAGVMFAQEIILDEFTAASFVPMVISSVLATAISQILLGNTPAFSVPSYQMRNPLELLLYGMLGILASLVALLFVKTLYKTEDIFSSWRKFPEWLKPVLGGLIIGIIGLKLPQILGVGYDTIGNAFLGKYGLWLLLALGFAKVIATSVTLGSGHSGGVFAPSLFMGATFGGAFGLIVQQMFPAIVGNPGAYSIVGMGAVVAGATQAPITAILIIFEMTRDYRLILPLMIAVVLSTSIFNYLSKGNIYTLKLIRRGVNLKAGIDVDITQKIMVKDIITFPDYVVAANDKVGKVIQLMHDSKHNGFAINDEDGKLKGIIALEDIRNAPVAGIMDLPVDKIMSTRLIVAYPDETVQTAITKLKQYDIGHLPVVSRDEPDKLIGFLTKTDLLFAYDQELMKKKRNEEKEKKGIYALVKN